jgi:aspartate/methionine/tyrosine aminotransferase
MSDNLRVSKRVGAIAKSAIHEMARLSKQVKDVAFLSWARPTSDTPENIKEAAISAIRNGLVGGYSETSGLPALREEIVRKLKRDNNVDANVAQVLVTVGGIEGLAAAVMAVVDPGDEMILPTPTYSTHIRQVVIASGKPVLVPTIEEEGFVLDIAGIRKAITPRTKRSTGRPTQVSTNHGSPLAAARAPFARCARVTSSTPGIRAPSRMGFTSSG